MASETVNIEIIWVIAEKVRNPSIPRLNSDIWISISFDFIIGLSLVDLLQTCAVLREILVARKESYHINTRFINIPKYFIEAMQGVRKIARLSTWIYRRA